ncbi:YecA family protein [Pseudoalteromonas rubra]|uniref:YecA family protein n=1 Tax=Pseudoalteromonas rubra TaxID=43658 RepID=UPI000F7B12E1|nr:SEC-C metal-binding domain-containing protein [Pseudoalteromonas rubra]
MKTGRNDPCPCGSGKKYKRCCMNNTAKLHGEVSDDVEALIAMNPDLTMEELNVALQYKTNERNNQPLSDFCGLSPTQMQNWLYAPFDELQRVKINTPEDVSASPVMRYLTLILDEAMQNDGAFKATSKGNLPMKLVKQASDLRDEFTIGQVPYVKNISICEFAGSNEDKFNALHYTRILAEIAGIIYRRSGKYHVKKTAQKDYQKHGVQTFFKPMLEAAVSRYNWAYLDAFDTDLDLRTFWLFMLWRLQSHANVGQLIDELNTAFPDLLLSLPVDRYLSPPEYLRIVTESRFIERFLQFWGFAVLEPKWSFSEKSEPRKVTLLPLLADTFQFSIA